MAAPVIPAITSGYADFLQPRWNRVIVEVGSDIENLYEPIMNVGDLAWAPMQESQASGLGPQRLKGEGSGFAMDSIIQGGSVTYTPYSYGLGFRWTIELMRYDLYNLFDDTSSDLLRTAPHQQELRAWGVWNDAFVGASYTGFDGLALCSAAHPYLDTTLGTFSNISASNFALSVAGIQEMLLHYATLSDMRGLPNKRRPSLILISPYRVMAAREVLQSEFDPKSANNAINTIVDDQLKYYAVRYLTSQSAWFSIAAPTGGPTGHDVWFRWGIRPLPDQFEDRFTKSSVQTIFQNFATGFGGCFGVFGSQGNGA